MAPHWPEEVDVFSEPHSRMKKLVHKYSKMVSTTDFTDECHMRNLLQNLIYVFCEFKAHEEIENMLIMRNLKRKLKAACVTSAAVCNCHSDNRLTDMLEMVVNGSRSPWTEKSVKERQSYGHELQKALEDFTENFLPHMEEEEEVFQPMLMQYFTYEELKELKAKVIQEHLTSTNQEKYIEDLCQKTPETKAETEPCYFDLLPDEVCEKIFSYLNPQDLCRSAQTCHRWNTLTKDASLWTSIYPVHWAAGNWTFHPEPLGGVDGAGEIDENLMEEFDPPASCQDEDADVDESSSYYCDDGDAKDYFGDEEPNQQVLAEVRILSSLVKHLLPCVGSGVKVVDLAYSKGLNNSLVHKILKLCPNIEDLDLTHTQVGDDAFYEYGVSNHQSSLRHLDLTNCHNITDQTLCSLIGASVNGITHNELDAEHYSNLDHDLGDTQAVRDESDIEIIPVCCGKKQNGNKSCVVPTLVDDGKWPNGGCCCVEVELSAGEKIDSMHRDTCEGSKINGCDKKRDCGSGKDVGLRSHKLLLEGDTQSEVSVDDDVQALPLVFNAINVQNSVCECEVSCYNSENPAEQDACCKRNSEPLNPKLLKNKKYPRGTCCSNVESSDISSFDRTRSDGSCCIQLPESTTTTTSNFIHDGNDEIFCDCNDSSATGGGNRYSCSKHDVTLHDQLPLSQNYVSRTCPRNRDDDDKIIPMIGNEGVSTKPLSDLQFLSVNGCYGISDMGLRMLSSRGGTPRLQHLDLSGCVQLTGSSVHQLVSTCGPQFDHANLFYCDNLPMDPYPTTASGCRNRGCGTRFCCSAD